VCGVLDEALAAAGRMPAQAPATVLQQLRQARQLYDSDRDASCKLIEGLLNEAEVSCSVGVGPAPAHTKSCSQHVAPAGVQSTN
jgi:hypothetical protein